MNLYKICYYIEITFYVVNNLHTVNISFLPINPILFRVNNTLLNLIIIFKKKLNIQEFIEISSQKRKYIPHLVFSFNSLFKST